MTSIAAQMAACREATEKFWRDTLQLNLVERGRRYIRELLPQELALAAERGTLPDLSSLPGERCDLLVLLVGYSFEPLLQAICAYRPVEVLLVLNRQYHGGGKATSGMLMERRLRKLIPLLTDVHLVDGPVCIRRSQPLRKDSPSEVFCFLLEHLRSDWEKQSIVIDITGAKKSMVAGAFFFAAYANLPISYVDFSEYDRDFRRPYGCACEIGLVDNPYRRFRLRDWAEVRRLYGQYAFGAARALVERLREEMEHAGYFEPDALAATRRLLGALEIYEAWDSGDYHAAAKLAAKADYLPQSALPGAIEMLANWPHASSKTDPVRMARELLDEHLALKYGNPAPEDSLFAQPQKLRAYVEDELAKVRRLLDPKEDYRTAFLRAVGLEEFLLKTRAALRWIHGDCCEEETRQKSTALPPSERARRFRVLSNYDSADVVRKALTGEFSSLHLKGHPVFKAKLREGEPLMQNYDTENEPFLQSYRDHQDSRDSTLLSRLRGEAIHTHLYIPRPVAEAAVTLVANSHRELVENWLEHYYLGETTAPVTEAPEWEDLCAWCGIDFLPPYREEDTDDSVVVGRGSG